MGIAYFDCYSGIAGDMVLGALIDVGCPVDFFKNEIKKLGLVGYRIEVKKVEKNTTSASDVTITVDEDQPHRTYTDIKGLISESALDPAVKDLSLVIFSTLAHAESTVHQVEVEQVHFHEVGAVDSIIDIVGSVICLKKLGIHDVFSSALPLGSGFVICQHGKLPVPVPATVELVRNVPTYHLDSGHEMVTPTGAAIITTIAKEFGKMPDMEIKKVGYGAGKTPSKQPGLLRVYLGKIK